MPKRQTFRNVMSKVDVRPGGCWRWTASLNNAGYGQVVVDQQHYLAHIYIHNVLIGPVPKGMQLGHSCHDKDPTCLGGVCHHRACVNPAHVIPMTPAENIRAGRSGDYLKNRTHCPRGHPWSGKNIYVRASGVRECNECRKIRAHDAYVKKKYG